MCKTLLALHILGVFMIVGGAAIATALGIRTARSRHTRTIAELSGISIFAERFVITPGAILALAAGTLLARGGLHIRSALDNRLLRALDHRDQHRVDHPRPAQLPAQQARKTAHRGWGRGERRARARSGRSRSIGLRWHPGPCLHSSI